MARYQYKRLGYLAPPELSGAGPGRYSVAIVGAGPIGLALAIDLALQGISSVLLDDNDMVSRGSRAICWAKRTLEIFDRLGVGDRMLAKGVTWKIGRAYHRDREALLLRSAAGSSAQDARFHQFAAVLRRGVS